MNTNTTIKTAIPGSLNAWTPNSQSLIETRLLVSRVIAMAKSLTETDAWQQIEDSAQWCDPVNLSVR